MIPNHFFTISWTSKFQIKPTFNIYISNLFTNLKRVEFEWGLLFAHLSQDLEQL